MDRHAEGQFAATVDLDAYSDIYARASGTAPASDDRRPRVVASFSPLEWLAIVIGQVDGIASLEGRSRMSHALAALFGRGRGSRLASDRLESLRRMAAFADSLGANVPACEVEGFYAAGYRPEQLNLLIDSLESGKPHRARGDALAARASMQAPHREAIRLA